ncbi:MAG: MFS transporter [Acidobacteria bacterium]|nr:MFS transporter [Acidobacteriota bacterium]
MGAALVLAMSTWFSTAAVLGQLRDSWSLSTTDAAWLTIAVQLGFVFGAVMSAITNLADRINPRRLFLYGSIAAAGANTALVAADGLTMALPARFATGVALAAVYPPAMKAIASWFREGRGVALGVMIGGLTAGSALPHLVNGVGGLDWHAVILVTSALTLAGGIIADRLATDGPFAFPSAPFDPRQVQKAFANRKIRLATLGYFGHMWELYAMWAWFAAFALDELTTDPQTASLITFAVIGVGALGSVVGGRISDAHGRHVAAGLAMVASGGTAAIIGFVDGPTVLVVGLAMFWGFWVVADSAQFSTIVSEEADQRYVGTALTVQLAAGFILSVFTIFLVPMVRDAAGWGWAFLLLAPGPLLGAIAMRRLSPRYSSDDLSAQSRTTSTSRQNATRSVTNRRASGQGRS